MLSSALRYGLDYYSFNNPPGPINWDYINTLTLSSVLRWKINDNWSAYGGGFVRMSAESGTALNEGTSGGGMLGATYKQSETLSYGLGLVVMSQLEDDAKVLPLPSLKWKFDDNWRLDVGLNDVSTLGYGADLSWLFSQEVTFEGG